MLQTLSIHDVVLIDRLELSFANGLGVLTGETGAGKSILLDALGLALGVRADARLVRHGAKQATVSATFDLSTPVGIEALLEEHGLEVEDGTLILRRILTTDGRSRAFVNDQPVSISLLKSLGEALVEVHGQFESQRLLKAANHRGLLDVFGDLKKLCMATATAWDGWREAATALGDAAERMATARREEDYLRHAVGELGTLDPMPGEEKTLDGDRTLMMHGEKLIEAMNKALEELSGASGTEQSLGKAVRLLEQVAGNTGGRLDAAIGALERASVEATEGLAQLEKASNDMNLDPARLEQVEERLFALRAQGRKHGVAVDDLADVLANMKSQLAAVEDGDAHLKELERAEGKARAAYGAAADHLSTARTAAAKRLDKAMAGELTPLKLEKARFSTSIDRLPEAQWSRYGADDVAFQVSTNPGAPSGPLNKIASGGELSRFMLALKAVLADADRVPTVIFDEVDSGIGGAVAAAVGERLAALSNNAQVLVVTHSPQVASKGDVHWRVSKSEGKKGTVLTSIDILDEAERKEEIARMLAGATVTDEARAAAHSLLQGTGR